MIKWIRTSRLSIKNSLKQGGDNAMVEHKLREKEREADTHRDAARRAAEQAHI